MPTISRQSAPAPIAAVLYRLYGFTYKDAPQSGHRSLADLMAAEAVVTFAAWLRRLRGSGYEPGMRGGK